MITQISLSLLLSLSAHAADLEIPKAQFLTDYKKELPEAFCGEKSYFRKCYSLEADKCKPEVVKALDDCLSQIEKDLPATFKQPADGQLWGKRIGECTGLTFENSFSKLRTSKAECDEPKNWNPAP